MKKNILLPSAFLTDAYRLTTELSYYNGLDDYVKSLCASLESQIAVKFDAMGRRETFSKYKAAKSDSDERELYRREYLDKAGIHRDWISEEEISFLP